MNWRFSKLFFWGWLNVVMFCSGFDWCIKNHVTSLKESMFVLSLCSNRRHLSVATNHWWRCELSHRNLGIHRDSFRTWRREFVQPSDQWWMPLKYGFLHYLHDLLEWYYMQYEARTLLWMLLNWSWKAGIPFHFHERIKEHVIMRVASHPLYLWLCWWSHS